MHTYVARRSTYTSRTWHARARHRCVTAPTVIAVVRYPCVRSACKWWWTCAGCRPVAEPEPHPPPFLLLYTMPPSHSSAPLQCPSLHACVASSKFRSMTPTVTTCSKPTPSPPALGRSLIGPGLEAASYWTHSGQEPVITAVPAPAGRHTLRLTVEEPVAAAPGQAPACGAPARASVARRREASGSPVARQLAWRTLSG